MSGRFVKRWRHWGADSVGTGIVGGIGDGRGRFKITIAVFLINAVFIAGNESHENHLKGIM